MAQQASEMESLKIQIAALKEFLKEQEAWEGMMLNDDGPWFEDMPSDIYDKMMEVQQLRNHAKKLCGME